MKSKWQILEELIAKRPQTGRHEPKTRVVEGRSCPSIGHLHPDYQKLCFECVGTVCAKMAERGFDDLGQPLRTSERPNCGAKTRTGENCLNKVVPGKRRCKLHGGKSTGPKTEGGKERIARAQRRRWEFFRKGRQKPLGIRTKGRLNELRDRNVSVTRPK